jgi:hypothetical protein
MHVAGIDPGIVDAELAPGVREDGCIWIDALPRLAAVYGQSHRDMFYRVDGHLTAEGNRVLGSLVAGTSDPPRVEYSPRTRTALLAAAHLREDLAHDRQDRVDQHSGMMHATAWPVRMLKIRFSPHRGEDESPQ